jgi:hypothetical protein
MRTHCDVISVNPIVNRHGVRTPIGVANLLMLLVSEGSNFDA